jgi:peptide deformylase
MPRWFLPLMLLASACASTAPTRPTPPVSTDPGDLPIVQTGAAVLRTPARPVRPEEIATPEFQALVTRMIAAMRAAPGVGLAAPQLGIPLRVFVLEDRAELHTKLTPDELRERERVPFPVRIVINPIVTPIGEARATFFEGCLSVRGFAALVERPLEVEVQGLDEHAQPQVWRVRGWPARILQHELDHLDGRLYVDRMMTRSFSTLDAVKARFAGKPIAQILGELARELTITR